ncbi:Xenotropic and polytropic retroviru receptor 1 [Taenia solium]|eukprot:TsM_001200400 transcript=TsM_001200400 gene=TsM_001200400
MLFVHVAQASGKSVFRFGFFLGIFLSEILCIILVAVFAKLPQFSYPAFRLFRGSFLVIYYVCMVGVNVYGWRSSGVNHVLIFEIDPRSHLNQFQLMEMGMFLADFWGAAVLLYQFSDLIHFPGYVTPLVLFTTMLVFLILPFHVFHFKSRFWLLKILFRIIRAPLARVHFPDFFLADQLNSLSFVLPDIAYFLCFFVNFIDNQIMIKSSLRNSTIPPPGANQLFVPKAGFCDGMMWGLQPILKALPAWWRFLQCLRRYRDLTVKSPVPHLMNAGKYSTTLIAIVCSAISSINPHTAFFVLMILSKLCSSVCTTTWDLVMDWGLLDCSSKENMLLRDELVYRFRAYYYGAIVEDVVIRFAWILPIAFSHFRIVDVEIITTIVMFAEVTRRIIWNFFRLENEHLNNCGNFRAVRDIGIAPIRKETSPPPVTQEGDKAYGMFSQLFTLNRNTNANNNNGSNDNSRDSDEINQDFDAGGSGGSGGGVAMENAPLPATLAEYATMLLQNNHKSLWTHLRENYLQTKKEKRRRMDFDRIVSMEEALRAAKTDIQSKLGSVTLPPRGATPTKDPAKVHAHLCEKVHQLSFNTTATIITATQQPENAPSLQPPPLSKPLPKTAPQGRRECCQRLRPDSVPTRLSEGARNRCIVADVRQRKALTKPQQPTSAENRASACLTSVHSTGDFPAKASGTLQPRSEEASVNRSLDPVIALEMPPHFHSDDSPGDTVLPVRTSLLANRLRVLLNTFNSGNSTTTAPSSSSAVMMASGGGSRSKRWQHDTAGGHRIVRAQTTVHGRLNKKEGKDEAESRSGLAGERSGDFGNVIRPIGVSVLESSAVDSGGETWDTSIDLNVEDTEGVEWAQLYVTPEAIYVCPF